MSSQWPGEEMKKTKMIWYSIFSLVWLMIAATSKTDICHVYFWPLPNVKNQPFIFPTTRWQEAFDTLMSGTACKIVVDAQTWDFGQTGTFPHLLIWTFVYFLICTFSYLDICIFAHSISVWALNIFFFNKYNFTTSRFEWKLEQTDRSCYPFVWNISKMTHFYGIPSN